MRESEAERKLCKAVDELMEAANEELCLGLSDEERVDRNLADAKARDVIAGVVKSAVRFKKFAEWHQLQGRDMRYCLKVLISAPEISGRMERCEG